MRTDGLELVNGSGVVRGYGFDLSQWQILRFSLPNDGSVHPYLWDGNTSSWTDLGAQGLGGSGGNLSPATAAGFAIGSMAGSSTQSGKFQIDKAYIDNAAARGGEGLPLWVPEPTTLVLLALGVMPLLRRRR